MRITAIAVLLGLGLVAAGFGYLALVYPNEMIPAPQESRIDVDLDLPR